MSDLIALATGYRETFLLVFFRLGGLLAFAPVVGHRAVPALHRAGLAVLLALVLTPVVGRGAEGGPTADALGLGLAVAGELIVGLAIGFVATLAVAAVQSAAEIVGFQMGLGIASVYDPGMGQQMSVLAHFQEVVALLLFLALNGHHLLLQTVAASFQRIQPGAVPSPAAMAAGAVSLGSKLFRSGLELAAPLVAVLFVTNVVLALLARVAPQLNVFAVGAPLTLVVGLLGVVEGFPYFVGVVTRLFGELTADARTVLLGVSHGF